MAQICQIEIGNGVQVLIFEDLPMAVYCFNHKVASAIVQIEIINSIFKS